MSRFGLILMMTAGLSVGLFADDKSGIPETLPRPDGKGPGPKALGRRVWAPAQGPGPWARGP